MHPTHARTSRPRLGALVLALALALAQAACGGDADEPHTVGDRARATAVAAPAPAPATPDSAAGEVAMIRGLSGGDRACYLAVDAGGARTEQQEAAFELCQRRDLVGKRVRLERRRTWVLAASCEGDPECARRDTVDLIVSARVMPEDGSAAAGPARP